MNNLVQLIGFLAVVMAVTQMIVTKTAGKKLTSSFTEEQKTFEKAAKDEQQKAYMIGAAVGVVLFAMTKGGAKMFKK